MNYTFPAMAVQLEWAQSRACPIGDPDLWRAQMMIQLNAVTSMQMACEPSPDQCTGPVAEHKATAIERATVLDRGSIHFECA